MTTLPGDTRRTVPVTVDGTPLNLMLDTGGFVTSVWSGAAEKAKLDVQKSGSLRFYMMDGSYSTQTAAADEFMIGRMRFSKTRLVVFPTEAGDRRPEHFDGCSRPICCSITTWSWTSRTTRCAISCSIIAPAR